MTIAACSPFRFKVVLGFNEASTGVLMSRVNLCAQKSQKQTVLPHCNISSTVNQKPPETSPDTSHSITNQFHIKFMINHISFTSIPPIPISSTQQHLPILLIPLFLKLRILATVFPLFSFCLRFKKNQGLFYILACLIYLWFLSFPLDLISLFLI